MLIDTKLLRQRVFDMIGSGNTVAALYMVSGKEPTGLIENDLKNVRAINILDISSQTNIAGTGQARILSHKATLMQYSGYGAKFYQDGAYNDELWQDTYPVCVYPQDHYSSFDAPSLLGLLQMAAACYPQNSFESAYTQSFNGISAVIADFGSTLSFRKLSILKFKSSVAYSNVTIEYSVDSVTWTKVTINNTDRLYYVNFDARYIRYSASTTGAVCFAFKWQTVPKESAFTEETIDKIILVGNTNLTNIDARFTDYFKQNYIGIVLDVGTDVKVSDVKTGTALLPNFVSCSISLPSNSVEA